MVYTTKNRFAQIFFKNILAWIASLIVLIPMLLVLLNAFKSDGETLTSMQSKFMRVVSG